MLPDAPPPGTPHSLLYVCGHPRSRSTLLFKLLAATGHFADYYHEPSQAAYNRAHTPEYDAGWFAADAADTAAEAADRLLAARERGPVLAKDTSAAADSGQLQRLLRLGARVVFIRRDARAAAGSLYRAYRRANVDPDVFPKHLGLRELRERHRAAVGVAPDRVLVVDGGRLTSPAGALACVNEILAWAGLEPVEDIDPRPVPDYVERWHNVLAGALAAVWHGPTALSGSVHGDPPDLRDRWAEFAARHPALAEYVDGEGRLCEQYFGPDPAARPAAV